jgi:hypothetical protein
MITSANAKTEKPGSPMFISYLKRGKRFTTDKEVAIRVGQETERPPIDFISPRLRETYLKAWPELGEKGIHANLRECKE